MTEASYTAWDDKQYVWPPPDGWYEASDGKWWPHGYGPPKTAEQDEQPEAVVDRSADNGWQIDSLDDRAADGEHSVDVAADAAAGFGATTSEAAGLGFASSAVPDLDSGFAADPAAVDAFDVGEADDAVSMAADLEVPDLAGVGADLDAGVDVDVSATSAVDELTDPIPAFGEPWVLPQTADPEDSIEVDVDGATLAEDPDSLDHAAEEDLHQASVEAANEAFGTGLMPPMADRPAPVEETSQPTADVSAQAAASLPLEARPIDLDGEGFANAGQTTVTPGRGGPADQQAMLASPEKGSSRGLLFAILGVIALVAAGAALFYAIGGDDAEPTEEVVEATGPGSVNEPHPRATGVVVYYPDGGVEQRWIVEVLEPVRDATAELGPADEGLAFAATRIRVTNESGNDGASLDDLRFNLVDSTNAVVVRTDNSCPAAADDLDFGASVVLESSIEGTVCWAIPAGDLVDLKLGIESSKVQGRVHILLQ